MRQAAWADFGLAWGVLGVSCLLWGAELKALSGSLFLVSSEPNVRYHVRTSPSEHVCVRISPTVSLLYVASHLIERQRTREIPSLGST